MDKAEALRLFQKHPEHWRVALFEDKGFQRMHCDACGKYYWSIEQRGCPNCREYGFLGKPPAQKRLDYVSAWRAVEKFFVGNGHASVPRYPVICRHRPDLYFTIASIVDFQRIENGSVVFELPANPLVVPQMCLRFNDIPSTGVSGRHYTCFCMVGQHAVSNAQGYWKDETIALDFDMLTKALGIPEREISFVEDIWIGPGAFGTSLEYFVQGLELGNAVFTEFLGTPERYSAMNEKIVDMGAGLERFCWITQGTPTSYDAVFGSVMERLKRAAGIEYDADFFLRYARLAGALNCDEADLASARQRIAAQLGASTVELERCVQPLEALYAVAEHARTLAFAIADGGMPSNVGGGYNLRAVLRRALSFIDRFGFQLELAEAAEAHAQYLKPIFPELAERTELMREIMGVEQKRYESTLGRSKRAVSAMLARGARIDTAALVALYESNGIAPELVERIASEQGAAFSTPPDFYARLAERHASAKPEAVKSRFDANALPKTTLLFYEKPELAEANAGIIALQGNAVVLDETIFYAEAGGQDSDRGTIAGRRVIDVQKVAGVVFHMLDDASGLSAGQKARCVLDVQRRKALMRHHTATHIINAAAREVLGEHVWQHGAKKTPEHAHLDITHYEALTAEQAVEIEKRANEIAKSNVALSIETLPRADAEKRYGMRIYQGGAVPERMLRIVEIDGIDVEACGGTHCKSTAETFPIALLKTERIQDGVVRLEYASAKAAFEKLKEKEKLLREAASVLGVPEQDLPKSCKKTLDEKKEIEKKLVWYLTEAYKRIWKEDTFEHKRGVGGEYKLRVENVLLPFELARKVVHAFEGEAVVLVLGTLDGKVIGSAGTKSGVDIKKIITQFCVAHGGRFMFEASTGETTLVVGEAERGALNLLANEIKALL